MLRHHRRRHRQQHAIPHPPVQSAMPCRINATGCRSTTRQRESDPAAAASPWPAQSTESAQAVCAALLSGTKKILRPMSSPNTGSISARLTSRQARSLECCSCPAIRNRASRSRKLFSAYAETPNADKTAKAPIPTSTRPVVDAGRHHGRIRSSLNLRGLARLGEPSSSSSSIAIGMPGSPRTPRGAPDCERRKRGSTVTSSSQTRERVLVSRCATP